MEIGVWRFRQGTYSEGGGDRHAFDIPGFSQTNVTTNPVVETLGNLDLFGVTGSAAIPPASSLATRSAAAASRQKGSSKAWRVSIRVDGYSTRSQAFRA